MGRVAGKKLFSIMALCAMIGLLLLPIVVALPSLAIGADAPDAVKKEGEAKVEKGRDVYYKTEGIVVGAPAPKCVFPQLCPARWSPHHTREPGGRSNLHPTPL